MTTPLDCWLFFLRHAQELDADLLPEALNVPEVRWAMGDLVMITQNERDRDRYESRLKMQRDVYTALAEAEAKGQISRIQSFQRLLEESTASLEQLQTMSLVELESLAARLEARLSAKLAKSL